MCFKHYAVSQRSDYALLCSVQFRPLTHCVFYSQWFVRHWFSIFTFLSHDRRSPIMSWRTRQEKMKIYHVKWVSCLPPLLHSSYVSLSLLGLLKLSISQALSTFLIHVLLIFSWHVPSWALISLFYSCSVFRSTWHLYQGACFQGYSIEKWLF